MKNITVIGAGAWGTALAIVANRAACDVVLWDRNADLTAKMRNRNINETYLPGVFIDPSITLTNDLASACQHAELVILSVPAQYVRATCITLSNYLPSGVPVLISSKGIEIGSLQLMSEVVSAVLSANPVAVLSGPNFAHEIGAGLPAATTIACANSDLGEQIVFSLGSGLFRPYYCSDVIGTQIGGALKNVIAIACGIATGKNLGENARAAIITRSLAEMRKVCLAKGGRLETLMGLSGMGDLILTCTSSRSRNLSFGMAIGRGESVEELMNNNVVTVEGIHTAEAAVALSRELRIPMPISQAVYDVVHGRQNVDDTIQTLLSRPFTSEF